MAAPETVPPPLPTTMSITTTPPSTCMRRTTTLPSPTTPTPHSTATASNVETINDSISAANSDEHAQEGKPKKLRFDFILVWSPKKEKKMDDKAVEARRTFESNLVEEGLILEYDKEKKKEKGTDNKAMVISMNSLEQEGLKVEPDEGGHVQQHQAAEGDPHAGDAGETDAGGGGPVARDADLLPNYVRIHAPFEVLESYAAIMHLRMPAKKEKKQEKGTDNKTMDSSTNIEALEGRKQEPDENPIKRFFHKFLAPFRLSEEEVPPIEHHNTIPYSPDKRDLFDIPEDRAFQVERDVKPHKSKSNPEDGDSFFSVATRNLIVDYILRRNKFSDGSDNQELFGINEMIYQKYYTDAYPLHEGHWKTGSDKGPRKLLFDQWASWHKVYKFQPIDHVREYFGEKIGMYFAWLGLYTIMLVPAALFGLAVFIYGLIIMYTDVTTSELCDPKANITMCPRCDRQCPYWQLDEECRETSVSRIFDNGGTVFFAFFMSLWGTLFLEFWKRRQATLQYNWDLTNFVSEEEPPRPEYLAKLKDSDMLKINSNLGLVEHHLPFWRRRLPVCACSYVIVLFAALATVALLVGVIVNLVSMEVALKWDMEEIVMSNASDLTTSTVRIIYNNFGFFTICFAAVVNMLINVLILNWVYGWLAKKLTDWECLRTQSEYDNSLTVKLFTLQFVNYFSSIVYIAFFKGNFVDRPGDNNTFWDFRQQECSPGGCLIELCIQLAIIMAGKHIILNWVFEIVIPRLCQKFKKWWKQEKSNEPWERDFKLKPSQTSSLVYKHMEMLVLQFGFLTIFSAAFPLAPLFALICNIIVLRVDARMFTCHLRRPVAVRAAGIGIWSNVLYVISGIAIISNAFIIALTSGTIPRLVYQLRYSENGGLEGYVNFTLAYFNTADFTGDYRLSPELQGDVQMCRYRDFRNPPWEDPEYGYSEVFWHLLAARLAFVIAFASVMVSVTSFCAWCVSNVPTKLQQKIRKKAYDINNIILERERKRAENRRTSKLLPMTSEQPAMNSAPM